MKQQKQISEIINLWKVDKKQYVKKSSYSAYALLIENHVLPAFGNKHHIKESEVQAFVFLLMYPYTAKNQYVYTS